MKRSRWAPQECSSIVSGVPTGAALPAAVAQFRLPGVATQRERRVVKEMHSDGCSTGAHKQQGASEPPARGAARSGRRSGLRPPRPTRRGVRQARLVTGRATCRRGPLHPSSPAPHTRHRCRRRAPPAHSAHTRAPHLAPARRRRAVASARHVRLVRGEGRCVSD